MNKTCAVCGGEARPHWEKLSFWKCGSCGWMFRDPCPTPEELSRLYNTSWRAPEANKRDTGGTNIELSRNCARRLANSLSVNDLCPFDQPHLHASDLIRHHAAHLEVSHGSNVEWDGRGLA
jgi:hypothetical protein